MTFIFNVYCNRVCVYVWNFYFFSSQWDCWIWWLEFVFSVILSELIVHYVIIIYSHVVLACYLCHFIKCSFKNGGFFMTIKIWSIISSCFQNLSHFFVFVPTLHMNSFHSWRVPKLLNRLKCESEMKTTKEQGVTNTLLDSQSRNSQSWDSFNFAGSYLCM